MVKILFRIVSTILLSVLVASSRLNILKSKFDYQFQQTCNKYPFVKVHQDILKNGGSQRYVVMVVSEKDNDAGGLGDRIAGIINAQAVALRLNRTLLLESVTGFEKLFRPYNSFNFNFKKNPYGRYTYENWTSWTHFNYSHVNHDETEYDLWYCRNRNNNACGLFDGDVPQDIIRMRTNRVLICYWLQSHRYWLHEELKTLGITHWTDLMEAAGCLLRLAMWPTDAMWEAVLQAFSKNIPSFTDADDVLPYILAMHFRCGDQSFLNPGPETDQSCRYNSSMSYTKWDETYMKSGNPVQIASCAGQIYHNVSTKLDKIDADSSKNKNNVKNNSTAATTNKPRRKIATFITSDSSASASQLLEESRKWPELTNPPTVAEKGCHEEYDKSYNCTLHTVANFMVLSFADAVVNQVENNHPKSAFVRGANMYGLNPHSYRDYSQCGHRVSQFERGFTQSGNWRCKE